LTDEFKTFQCFAKSGSSVDSTAASPHNHWFVGFGGWRHFHQRPWTAEELIEKGSSESSQAQQHCVSHKHFVSRSCTLCMTRAWAMKRKTLLICGPCKDFVNPWK